jgi:DNA-binding NarL/FixJ family response regulator
MAAFFCKNGGMVLDASPAQDPMTLLLVDDHPLLHEVLAAVARRVYPEATILFATSLTEALEQARETRELNLVLLDLGLPGCARLEALSAFRKAFPELRVVVVSATEDPASIIHALNAGAAGYVPKTHPPALMVAALKVVAEGGTYVPPHALQHDEPPRVLGEQRSLTKRQVDVLRLLAKGLANKQIARHLRIARDTVKQHVGAVCRALGVTNRAEAARAAERRGIKLD